MKQGLKKCSYLAVTAILILSLLCLFSYRNDEGAKTVKQWSADELIALVQGDFAATPIEGGVSLTPLYAGSQIKLVISDASADLVRIQFAEQPTEGFRAGMYVFSNPQFTYAEGEGMRNTGAHSAPNGSQIFLCADGGSFSVFSLELSSTCVIQSVTAESVSADSVQLTFNPIACIVLLGGLLLLLLVESKYHYYEAVLAVIRREFFIAKELFADGKRWQALLYLLSWVVTLAFLLAVSVFVMLGIYTKASMLASLIGVALSVALHLFSRLACDRNAEPAKLFLTVTVLLGLLLCYVLPPCIFVSWDDEFHFQNAYSLSHFLDKDYTLTEQKLITYRQFPIENYAKDPEAFITEMERWSAVEVARGTRWMHPYTALSYLPAATAMGLLSLLQSDTVTVMVLARFANLLAFALLVYFGIRKLRSGAFIFASVCLLPTVLFIACTYGYDFWLIAWMAYAYGTLISILQGPDRRITKADMIKLLLAFFIGCAPKSIYCFMMLPLLFLPKKKFADPAQVKRFRLWVVGVLLLILAILALPGLLIPDLYTDTRGGSDVSAGGQIKFILSNPFRYADILFRFLGEYCSISSLMANGSFFAHLGNLNIAKPDAIFRTLSVFLLLYCIFTDRKKDDGYELMQPTRWISLATAFVQLVLVATSLYVGFTPVGHDTINGCSYRYIFPMLLPFCFFMAPKGIKATINPKFQSAFVFGALALNVCVTVQMVYLSTFV